MGLLDQLLGGLTGAAGGASPLQGVLSNLLGSGQAGGQGLSGVLGGLGGGGLAGLVQRFQGAGLGGIAQSWIGTGANQPVSPEQLQGVLGAGQVQSMAAQSGMAPNDLLSQLSQHLPGLVDRMTPNGMLPPTGGPGQST